MPKRDDTPLMQQWRSAKSKHPDALVFFRVGDFYEMFNEDAEEGARLLGLTLTSRNNGGAAEVPLAGVPVRARDEYIERLVRMGKRVAVCEQVEDPADAKGIVRREVTETITPGAVLADALLSGSRNNFLVSLAHDGHEYGVAAADISTGEVVACRADQGSLEAKLARFEPAELLLPRAFEASALPLPQMPDLSKTYRADWLFDREQAGEELCRRYGVQSIAGFGFESADDIVVCALGALLAYLAEVQPTALTSLRAPRLEREADAMVLDEMTRRNLELLEPMRLDANAARGAGTLVSVLDETVTSMGARSLRRWLLRPLVDADKIWLRQEAVGALLADPVARRAVRAALKDVRDLERLAAKLAVGRIQPRELVVLAASLARVPELIGALADMSVPMLARLRDGLDPLTDVRETLERALEPDAPASLGAGDVIRTGWDPELDELRAVRDGGQDTLARLQARERERTGISSLKVGYNKVFGYYLEVTHANRARVPTDYERKQTLANSERYVTPELKEWEAKILGAEERIADTESRLYGELRLSVAEHTSRLQGLAERVGALDVMAGLAQLAERRQYVRPEVHTGYALEIEGGRHPVVETMMSREQFIPNDVVLDEDRRFMILTGPNMAGKSTLLRQVGLIQLLAQIGSYVPATRARVPVCDRIFTRVGASDNLVRGQSTFMVEMQETAAILHGASASSLVLLDEIGRGTATYDGVSIAWAVTEHLHAQLGAKAIFATHYHELTQLADMLPGVVNYNVAVREAGEEIVFLHQLRPGGADRSYGIEVGRLAGLPGDVLTRAREILIELEGAHAGGSGTGLGRSGAHRPPGITADQLSLFRPTDHPLLTRLRELDPDRMTPLDALTLLSQLVRDARED